MRVFCVFVTVAVCLLLLSGCGAGTTIIEAAAGTTGSITADDQIAARRPAESEDQSEDDLRRGEQHSRHADFGLGDPGVIVISADQGGDINWYESKYFGVKNRNTRWVVDGYCYSACTMVLGTGRVCATPRAQFGFHAGYTDFGLWKVIGPRFTYQMYRHYPDNVKDWVNMHHAMDQTTMTPMRQREVANYVPSCRT